jgi:hypothetical protein
LRYVGLDVHQATTVSTVREESGRVVARGVVPTEAGPLVEYFRGMRGVVQATERVAKRALERGRTKPTKDLLFPARATLPNDEQRERIDVLLKEHEQTNQAGQQKTMKEYKTKDPPLVALPTCGGTRDTDALRVDHFSHHTA